MSDDYRLLLLMTVALLVTFHLWLVHWVLRLVE